MAWLAVSLHSLLSGGLFTRLLLMIFFTWQYTLVTKMQRTIQAGMSCAQPQVEVVSLEKKASFLLKIYIRPVVVEIFPLSLGFKFG